MKKIQPNHIADFAECLQKGCLMGTGNGILYVSQTILCIPVIVGQNISLWTKISQKLFSFAEKCLRLWYHTLFYIINI